MNTKTEKDIKKIGGQAVIEGVMMRGENMYAVAVRGPDNEIKTIRAEIGKSSAKFRKLPIVRGVFSFVDSLITGTKVLTISAELAGLDDETGEPSKFEKWLTKVFGDKLNKILMGFSVAVALVICVAVFILLPAWIGNFANVFLGDNTWALGIIEGFIRIILFVAYVFLISRSRDIQRVFQYHGAEHKTINCLENGVELNVENVKKFSTYHKRCGTSFLLIVMIISMLFFMFIRTDVVWLRAAYRIILIPVIAGLSYELIKWAGRSDSIIVKAISFPGKLMQKMTTSEPSDDQIEVAIVSLKEVLAND